MCSSLRSWPAPHSLVNQRMAGQSKNVTGNVVRRSHATLLIELAADIELFYTPDHEAFVTFQVDDHFETWPLKAKSFRRWLARGFHEQTRATPSAQALQDARGVIGGASFVR